MPKDAVFVVLEGSKPISAYESLEKAKEVVELAKTSFGRDFVVWKVPVYPNIRKAFEALGEDVLIW